MKVRFWGTRGSLARPGPSTLRYGGNTSCVEVMTDGGTRLVIDCGTGSYELGRLIVSEGKPSRGHLLISHTHWDHIQGIPFFTPFFVPGHEWDLYAPQGFRDTLKNTLAGQMEYTYFPITLETFAATLRYHDLGEGHLRIDDVVIRTRYLNHPALALAFRIECDGACLIYACDHEPHSHEVAHGMSELGGEDRAHAGFMAGADLIIHDAQYLAEEFASKRGWGHSTHEYAVLVARTAGAKKVALTHHDPARSDDEIDIALGKLCEAASAGSPEIIAASEGLVIDLLGSPMTHLICPTADDKLAIRKSGTDGIAKVLLVVADETLAARIANAVVDEPIELTRVRTESHALSVIHNVGPDLVLVEDGLLRSDQLAALGEVVTESRPLVLLGGHGPADNGAVDRLDEPWSTEYARTRIRTWLMRTQCHWVRAPIPADEAARLDALQGLGILDTAPEERFDTITRRAAELFDVPVALISLVDADRQWFKSRHGFAADESSRDSSFCAHAVASRSMLVVPDALADARFRDNPLVMAEPRIRFYAGAPLHGPDGHVVGTLCLLDDRPRDLSERQRGQLADLAAGAEQQLLLPRPD